MKNEELKKKKYSNVNVRVGDTVLVISGKDKGKKGKVENVNPETNRCVVTGVNMVIKHKKARSQTQKSERKSIEGTIDISNVMIICPKCDKATRVSNTRKDGIKHRICKKCGEVLDKKYIKPKKKDIADDKKEAEPEDKKAEKKPLQRREVKHTAESVIKKPTSTVKPSTKLPRKMGGE
jgi:large subunit ribosomal protein L24